MKTEDDIEIALVSNVNDQGSLVNQSMSNSLDKISQSLENLLQPTRKILNFSKRQISEQTSLIQQADTITKRLTNMLDNITRRAKEVEEKGVRCDMQAMQAQVNQIKCSMIELLNNKVFQKLHDLDIAFNDGNAERSTANIDFSKDILSQLGSYQLKAPGNKKLIHASSEMRNTVTAEQLTINGYEGCTTVKIAACDSMDAIANAINNQAKVTGVIANASTQVLINKLSAEGFITFDLRADNNVPVTISARVILDDLTNLKEAINCHFAATGIFATTFDELNALKLGNVEGKDLVISNFSHSAATDESMVSIDVQYCLTGATTDAITLCTGKGSKDLNSVVISGSLNFISNVNFTVQSNLVSLDNANSVFAQLEPLQNSQHWRLMDIDISMKDLASSAFVVIDTTFVQLDNIQEQIINMQQRFLEKESSLQKINQHAIEALGVIRCAELNIEGDEEKNEQNFPYIKASLQNRI
jgi:hypothetical protein